MGDGGMKGERSGTRSEADWAGRDEDEIVVGIKIHGGRGMFREAGGRGRGSQYQWFTTERLSANHPPSLLPSLPCLLLFAMPPPPPASGPGHGSGRGGIKT